MSPLCQSFLLVLLCARTLTFPTEEVTSLKKSARPETSSNKTSTELEISNSGSKSPLPPQDKKQFLTYVLGQPKKTASLKTPSHLMNPDKYEFYTFDDDGQIVKKLMSVQEIQRLIANNERGKPNGGQHNPSEYYQIITVSPDVEPPPAVSRINPSEPLFSVHDVIASVQNVLKSEISLKRGPTRRPVLNDAKPNKTSEIKADPEMVEATTYRPRTSTDETTITAPFAPELVTESVPLSLSDAHPGFISNDTFLEPQPSVIEQLPQVEIIESTTRSTNKSEASKVPEAITRVQIPMNQDLAESVSSVLSQIASGISLGQLGDMLPTEAAMTRTNIEDEDNIKKMSENVNVEDIYLTTEIPETTTTTAEEVETVSPTEAITGPSENIEEEKTEETTATDDYQSTTINPVEEKSERIEAKEDSVILTETIITTTDPSRTPEEVTPGKVEEKRPPPEKLQVEPVNKTTDGVQQTAEAAGGDAPIPTGAPDEILKDTQSFETTTIANETKEAVESRVTEFFAETTTETQTDSGMAVNTEVIEVSTIKPSNKNENLKEVTEMGTTEAQEPEIRNENLDIAELKILPEGIADAVTQHPTTETTQKQPPVAATTIDDLQGSLKQNIAYKPFFSKPQKPVYIKPTKTKTPVDSKPTKPTSGKPPVKENEAKRPYENHFQSSPSTLELEAAPAENLGLEVTTAKLDKDVKEFTDLCNELAFSLWSSVTHSGLSFVRSLVVSPFAVTSLLAMVFLGARGPTSGQMNDVLKLDEMVTFNPHLVFRNVTESLVISRNPGVATAAFVRELYSDKSKGKLLDFYKERAQQFYDGHVEEVNFKTVGDNLRRQTNLLVKRQTWGKVTDFLRGSNLQLRPPLAAFSANIFQTDCSKASTKDRDGEMYFVVLPASRLRRLVPVPAVVIKDNFLAGYEPNLDATIVALNPAESAVSTLFVLPGQQGLIAPGDTLSRLERHLLGSSFRRGHWTRLMKSLLPRPGLELQIPRLSHRSVINVTTPLQRMGLRDLFSAQKADLTGLNGLANDLHLSDMLQVNLFSTCGEDSIGSRHVSEVYPATPLLRREKSSDFVLSDSIDNLFAVSDFEDPAVAAMPLELRPRQARIPMSKPGARIPEPPRLRFDRPFLFFVRHNPTGLILHMGRFNPRLTT